MTRRQTVDAHTHILTAEAVRLLGRESAKVAPILRNYDGHAGVLEIAGTPVQNPHPRGIWDVEHRVREMDTNGIDAQVLSPTVFTFFYQHEPALALACSVLQNDEIARVIRRQPDRFLGLGTVPLQAPEAAADELRRCIEQLGLRGAMIGSHVNGRNLDDPSLEPFWAVAAETGALVFIHPHAAAAADRLGAYYLKNIVGLPFETTIAAAALIFGGVLQRFPGLRICLSHGGGFVPYQIGRFCRGWEVRPEARLRMRGGPRQVLGQLFYDTIVHSRPTLEFLIASVGAEHVLLGSDYPFDMGTPDCVAQVAALDIAPDDRDRILGGYAAALLGFCPGN